MTEAGWTPNSEVESAIDELKAQVQKIYNAGFQQGRVAGLREAHVFAMEVGAFYTAHRIGALIDKAQQAQDEKGVGDGN